MLFNSYEFIFLFLIPVVFVSYLLERKQRVWFIIAASVLFYGEWSIKHLVLLLGLTAFNYTLSLALQNMTAKREAVLTAGVIANLMPLAWFKYGEFLHLSSHRLVLPLAISFFTFQQIAFLVDVYKRETETGGFRDYLFFILFFPQLVAGPIVHYQEMIPQIKSPSWREFRSGLFSGGLVLFSFGLFKKVVLADGLMAIADTAFGTKALQSYDAWIGVMAYSLGIYFDFGGYADMAVGLGLLLGICLPVNFNSPYKSRNVKEFWRRWHITLSRFLRDYVYIPLGGNRAGRRREAFNLLVTMLLGGIWHGAGWGFLLWGALHGVFLVISHFSRITLPKYVSIVLTFLVVSLLWVLFRADSISSAYLYYKALFSLSSFEIKDFGVEKEMLVAVSLMAVWFLPNSFEMIKYDMKSVRVKWWHAVIGGVMFFVSLKVMAVLPPVKFVYFDF